MNRAELQRRIAYCGYRAATATTTEGQYKWEREKERLENMRAFSVSILDSGWMTLKRVLVYADTPIMATEEVRRLIRAEMPEYRNCDIEAEEYS